MKRILIKVFEIRSYTDKMIRLDDLSMKFSLISHDAPASENDIEEMQQKVSKIIPREYIELMYQATEMEIKICNKIFIRIWSPKGCIEMNEAYQIQKYIPNSLGIGDDEGGNALVYSTGNNGFGLYLVSFSNIDVDDALFIAPSLNDLLTRGVGIETFLK